tara:strand:+ start:4934 stop:5629 length:696 start_codon:yes stop_codon:yes gene_type:complete
MGMGIGEIIENHEEVIVDTPLTIPFPEPAKKAPGIIYREIFNGMKHAGRTVTGTLEIKRLMTKVNFYAWLRYDDGRSIAKNHTTDKNFADEFGICFNKTSLEHYGNDRGNPLELPQEYHDAEERSAQLKRDRQGVKRSQLTLAVKKARTIGISQEIQTLELTAMELLLEHSFKQYGSEWLGYIRGNIRSHINPVSEESLSFASRQRADQVSASNWTRLPGQLDGCYGFNGR